MSAIAWDSLIRNTVDPDNEPCGTTTIFNPDQGKYDGVYSLIEKLARGYKDKNYLRRLRNVLF